MGELADRIRALTESVDWLSEDQRHEAALVAAGVEELEDGSEAVIERRRHELRGRYTDAASRHAVERAIGAEQRADALLAAVSKLVQQQGQCVAMARVIEVQDRYRAEFGWRTSLIVDIDGAPLDLVNPGGDVAIIAPSDTQPNLELLERAGVELLEEYQRLKAEENRRVTGTAATTASLDEVAREFCTQIVENVRGET